jgi:hypothetical protein
MQSDDTRPEFSVVVFFGDGTHAYFPHATFVPAAQALDVFHWAILHASKHKHPPVDRIIMTDGGDDTVFEWMTDYGFTYPPELIGRRPKTPEEMGYAEPLDQTPEEE